MCSELAAATQCLCAVTLESELVLGFASARLIPLDKQSGVRPIAPIVAGEAHKRIICRAIVRIVEHDVLRVTLQYPGTANLLSIARQQHTIGVMIDQAQVIEINLALPWGFFPQIAT
eukprot:scpid107330/ scgid13329/ 